MDVLAAAARVRSAQRVAVHDLEAVMLSTEWWLPPTGLGARPVGYRAAFLWVEMHRIVARYHRGNADEMTTVRELMGLLPS